MKYDYKLKELKVVSRPIKIGIFGKFCEKLIFFKHGVVYDDK